MAKIPRLEVMLHGFMQSLASKPGGPRIKSAVVYFKFDGDTAEMDSKGLVKGRFEVGHRYVTYGDENDLLGYHDGRNASWYRTFLQPIANPIDPSRNASGIVGGACLASLSDSKFAFEQNVWRVESLMNDSLTRYPLSFLNPFPNEAFFSPLAEELRSVYEYDIDFFYFRARDLYANGRSRPGGYHATTYLNFGQPLSYRHRCLSRVPRADDPVELSLGASIQDFGFTGGSAGELIGVDSTRRVDLYEFPPPGRLVRQGEKHLRWFRIHIEPPIPGLGIVYSAHVQDRGDTDWLPDGIPIRNSGDKRVEGIRIKLTGDRKDEYRVRYRAVQSRYAEGPGTWERRKRTPYCFDGDLCGSTGKSQPLLGLEVSIIKR